MGTMRKVPRLTNKKDKDEVVLDADLWGQLQDYIPLQTICEKMSQRDLFQLRIVSKEWNHAALQWILPKSSFVIITAGFDRHIRMHFSNDIVTCNNSASGKFKSDRQPLRLQLAVKTHAPPFEVEGLILCHNPYDLEERGVFNVHTRTWHTIPVSPEQNNTFCACGLLVDTAVKPYTFKLIEGNMNFKTQIYDSKSRSWSKASSWFPSSYVESRLNTLQYSCICNNNNIYISEGTNMILKYSLKDDYWTVLPFPKVRIREVYLSLRQLLTDNALGVWASRIFTTRVNHKNRRLIVWELVDFKGQEWVEYACMPRKQYKWLWKYDIGEYICSDNMCLRTFFRGGYMLLCSWWWDISHANKLVLFDIITKVWQKVD